jgi:hypothetical protein
VLVAYGCSSEVLADADHVLGDRCFVLFASVEHDFVSEVGHHLAEPAHLLSESAACKVFCYISVWQCYNVKAHWSPDLVHSVGISTQERDSSSHS